MLGDFEIVDNTFKLASTSYYINHVLVDESYRRKGIASDLFDWVAQKAAESGVTQIGLDTRVLNESAQRFFERKGFQLSRLVYSRRLE